MASKHFQPKAQPSHAPAHSDVHFPGDKFREIFNEIKSGTRLVLALHRIEYRNRDLNATPGELISWEAFITLSHAIDHLGHQAGY